MLFTGNRVRFSLINIDDLKSSDDNGFCGMFAANRLDVRFLESLPVCWITHSFTPS